MANANLGLLRNLMKDFGDEEGLHYPPATERDVKDSVVPLESIMLSQVRQDNFTLQISLMSNFSERESMSSLGIDRQIVVENLTSDDLRKLIHNFCMVPLVGLKQALTGRERPLSIIKVLSTRMMENRSDHLTPDLIDQPDPSKPNLWNVMEMKAPGTSNKRVIDLFAKRADKYKLPLENRSKGNVIRFAVVAVGVGAIVTNLPMDEETAFLIHSFRNIGVRAHLLAVEKGYVVPSEEERVAGTEFNLILKKCRLDSLGRMDSEAHRPPFISEEMVSAWDSLSTEGGLEKMKKFLRTTAKKELMNRESRKAQKYVKKFYDARNGYKTRDSKKTVCRTPLFEVTVPFYEWKTRAIDVMPNVPVTSVLSSIWSKAFEKIFELPEELRGQTLGQLPPDMEFPDSMTKIRDKRGRIKIDFSFEEMTHMNERGVFSKKISKFGIASAHKAESKLPFSLNVDCGDIDNFIESEIFNLLRPSRGGSINGLVDTYLTRLASAAWPQERLDTNFIEGFCRTQIAWSLFHLGCILEELNLSFRQSVESKEMLLKKLKGFDTYLLIRPTNASKPLSYSVFHDSPSTSIEGIFLSAEKCGKGLLTDFETLNRHKAAHYMFPLEKMMSLLAMWSEVFGCDTAHFWSHMDHPNNMNAIKHWAYSMLVFFEGKGQTAADLLTFRYAYMETMKISLYTDSGLKVLSKLSEQPRSRLLVWSVRRLIMACEVMEASLLTRPEFSSRKAEEDEEDEDEVIQEMDSTAVSADSTKRLYSFITMQEVPNFEVILNVMYVGVLHNRDEADEMHGYLKIFNKVMKEELAMREARPEYMGMKEIEDYSDLKDHEFSIMCNKLAGLATKDFFESKFGRSNEQEGKLSGFALRLDEKMIRAHIGKTLDTLATFKASAIRPTTSAAVKTNDPTRRKVMEGVIELLEEIQLEGNSARAFNYLPRVLEKLEELGGVFANLFSKLQLTGPREIFVLDFLSRLAIHFVETVCRVINEELPHEMLTKGDSKIKKNDAHYARVFKFVSKGFAEISVMSSDDATTWAQRFVMSSFGCVLRQILPPKYFDVVARILNLVTSKTFEMPYKLIEKLIKNEGVDSMSSPELNEFKRQLLEIDGEHDLVDWMTKILKNRSNMMQGILHYTSSLVHSSFLLLHGKICREMFNSLRDKLSLPHDCEFINSYQVSSDDSAEVSTVVFKGDDIMMKKKIMTFLTVVALMKKNMYPLFCAMQSREKSTTASFNGLVEFNSYFMLSNTLLEPVIKFVYAALNPSPVLSIAGRQHMMSNTRKSVLENGGTIFLCSIIQRMQALIHYKCLGLYTSDYFQTYESLLAEKPIPALGFFVFEPPLLVGFLGVEFSEYAWVKYSDVASRAMRAAFNRGNLEFDEITNRPALDLSIMMGELKTYYNFLLRMGIDKGWRDKADLDDEKAEMLFRAPENSEEVKYWIKMKATSRGAAEAFTFQAGNRLHTTSPYILIKPAVRVRTVKAQEIVVQKKSLLRIINELVVEEPLSEVQMSLLYPALKMYDRILEQVVHFSKFVPVPKRYRPANRLITIYIPKSESLPTVSLMDVVKRMWFPGNKKLKSRGTTTEIDYAFDYYSEAVPWLRRTLEETREASGLSTASIAEATKALYSKPTSHTILGPIKRNMPIDDTIKAIMKHCYFKTSMLEPLAPGDRYSGESLAERLVLLLTGPETQTRKIGFVRELMMKSSLMIKDAKEFSSKTVSRDDRKLGLIQLYFKSRANFYRSFNTVMLGKWGQYTVRGRINKQTGKYEGNSVYHGFLEGQSYTALIEGNTITSVHFNNIDSFKLVADSFSSVVYDERWEIPDENPNQANKYFMLNGVITESRKKSIALFYAKVEQPFLSPNVNLELVIDGESRIKLVSPYRDKATVLSFTAAPWRIQNLRPRPGDSDDMLTTWELKQSIQPELAYNLLDEIRLYPNDPEALFFKSWSQRTFIERTTRRFGETLPKSLLDIEQLEPDELATNEPELDLGRRQLDDFELDMDFSAELADLGAPIEDDDLDVMVIESLVEMMQETSYSQRAPEGRYTVDISASHPFWDRVIDQISAEGTNPLKLAISRERYTVSGDMSEMMAWVVDNDSREVQTRKIKKTATSKFRERFSQAMRPQSSDSISRMAKAAATSNVFDE